MRVRLLLVVGAALGLCACNGLSCLGWPGGGNNNSGECTLHTTFFAGGAPLAQPHTETKS
jgi:hypothetical protein